MFDGTSSAASLRPGSVTVKAGLAILVLGVGWVAWRQHLESGILSDRLRTLETKIAGVAPDVGMASGRAAREDADRIAALSIELNDRLNAQQEQAAALKVSVDRAIGQVVITQPPEDLRAAVQAALGRWMPLQRPAQLPPDGANLRDELALLELSMQTGLRDAFGSELRRLHWWADVLDASQSVHDDAARAESDYPQLRELRIAAPVLAPQWCFDAVRAAERRKLLALVQMRAGQEQASVDEVDAVEDLLNAVRREMGSDVPAFLVETSARLEAKRRSIVSRERTKAIDELVAERRKSIQGISDAAILLQLQAGYVGQLIGFLCNLPGDNPADGQRIESLAKEWSRDLRALEARIRNDQSLRYQKWALEQIAATETAGNRATGLDDDETAIMSAIRDHLLPIDTALLEIPIRKSYDDMWERWKDQLKDNQMTTLLQHVSETPKKGLGEV